MKECANQHSLTRPSGFTEKVCDDGEILLIEKQVKKKTKNPQGLSLQCCKLEKSPNSINGEI